jgi:hypothetical protein
MMPMKTTIEGKSITDMTGENVRGQRKIPASIQTITMLVM